MPIYDPNKVPLKKVTLRCPHCGAIIVSRHENLSMARQYAMRELGDHITQKHKESLN